MCYYNGVKIIHSEFIRLKNMEKAIAQYEFLNKPLLIGFDYQNIPVLKRVEGKEDFEIVEMEWGFLPAYIKTREQANKFRQGYKKENGGWQEPIITLNATSEEMLFENKIYRDAALHRRCLVLSSGFYEWRHVFPIGKKTGKPIKTAVKYPYHIGVKGSEYFYMAAIYNPWTDQATGEHVDTCAIVTTAANPLMEQIHNTRKRMPAILTENLAWQWLSGNPDEAQISTIGHFQFPAREMEACTIVKDFREAPDPAETFEYADLPPLVISA